MALAKTASGMTYNTDYAMFDNAGNVVWAGPSSSVSQPTNGLPVDLIPMSSQGLTIPKIGGGGGIPDFLGIGNIFGNSTGLGLNLPTAILAFGLYNTLIRRRRNMISLGALAYGIYATGIWQSLFPGETGTSLATKVGLAGILPTGVSTAILAGVGPALIGAVSSLFFRRRATRRRSYRSYRPRYRSYRRRRRY